MTHECGITGSVITDFKATFTGSIPPMLGLGARSVSGRYLWMLYVAGPGF